MTNVLGADANCRLFGAPPARSACALSTRIPTASFGTAGSQTSGTTCKDPLRLLPPSPPSRRPLRSRLPARLPLIPPPRSKAGCARHVPTRAPLSPMWPPTRLSARRWARRASSSGSSAPTLPCRWPCSLHTTSECNRPFRSVCAAVTPCLSLSSSPRIRRPLSDARTDAHLP